MRKFFLTVLISLALLAAACSYPYGDDNDYTLPVYDPPADDDDTTDDDDNDDDNNDDLDNQTPTPEISALPHGLKDRPVLSRP